MLQETITSKFFPVAMEGGNSKAVCPFNLWKHSRNQFEPLVSDVSVRRDAPLALWFATGSVSFFVCGASETFPWRRSLPNAQGKSVRRGGKVGAHFIRSFA
jgi:hypothetical protein